MKLDRVTITGADDSISPVALLGLSGDYPFVEWGILFSMNWQGTPRYPSERWIQELLETAPPKVSAHLCGRWVREVVLEGKFTWAEYFPSVAPRCHRVQLNFHGEFHRAHATFPTLLDRLTTIQFILQCDGVNDATAKHLSLARRAVPLFDTSGGGGLSPQEWPAAWPDVYCGYAGGLGPDNLERELERIAVAAGDATVWIDMERKVRSVNDRQFDLDKVADILERCGSFIEKNAAAV